MTAPRQRRRDKERLAGGREVEGEEGWKEGRKEEERGGGEEKKKGGGGTRGGGEGGEACAGPSRGVKAGSRPAQVARSSRGETANRNSRSLETWRVGGNGTSNLPAARKQCHPLNDRGIFGLRRSYLESLTIDVFRQIGD